MTTKYCNMCDTTSEIIDMDLKMGGLLCPSCKVILFAPYVDDEYFNEVRRRRKSEETRKARIDMLKYGGFALGYLILVVIGVYYASRT